MASPCMYKIGPHEIYGSILVPETRKYKEGYHLGPPPPPPSVCPTDRPTDGQAETDRQTEYHNGFWMRRHEMNEWMTWMTWMNYHVMSWGWMTYYHNVASGLISEREKKEREGEMFISGVTDGLERLFWWLMMMMMMTCLHWLVGWLVGLGWVGFVGMFRFFYFFVTGTGWTNFDSLTQTWAGRYGTVGKVNERSTT